MSNQNQAATLPDGQTAYNNLFLGVHQRVFFQKCAAAGFVPNSTQQAQWMLETAGKLRGLEQQMAEKQAAAPNDPYFLANQALDQVLSNMGMPNQAYQQEQAIAIKEAAFELASDPTFYNSVLALRAAEAADIQQALAQQGQ